MFAPLRSLCTWEKANPRVLLLSCKYYSGTSTLRVAVPHKTKARSLPFLEDGRASPGQMSRTDSLSPNRVVIPTSDTPSLPLKDNCVLHFEHSCQANCGEKLRKGNVHSPFFSENNNCQFAEVNSGILLPANIDSVQGSLTSLVTEKQTNSTCLPPSAPQPKVGAQDSNPRSNNHSGNWNPREAVNTRTFNQHVQTPLRGVFTPGDPTHWTRPLPSKPRITGQITAAPLINTGDQDRAHLGPSHGKHYATKALTPAHHDGHSHTSSPETVNNPGPTPILHVGKEDHDGHKTNSGPDAVGPQHGITLSSSPQVFHHLGTTCLYTPALHPAAVEEHAQRIAKFWPHTTDEAHEQFPEFCKLYQQIKSFNRPNALGARLTLDSGLNLNRWEHYLKSYHDKEVCAYLRFGWPVGFSGSKPPVSISHNHPSGENYKDHVRDFINTELQHQAIVGPFHHDPFHPWMRKSPVMSRPKKDSTKRRIIIDLTFPGEDGVNGGIDIHSVLGRDISYTLPTIWDLTNYLKLIGRGAWVWKADLERAYRQLRVDPLDTPLLGLQVDSGIFLDLCPSFGCRSSSAACQRTSNAVVYIMKSAGHVIYAYLDDFAGCAPTRHQADKAYQAFLTLLNTLGLKLAIDKCQSPTQRIIWLGYEVDTLRMMVSIPADKIQELKHECHSWLQKHRVTKKALQSLLGRILHAAPCIKHARKFTARLLALLRNMKSRNWTTLDDDAKADIRWFAEYAAIANGVTIYADPIEYVEFECDACLTGAGGNSTTHCYSWVFTSQHQTRFPHIHQLEAVNILVALKTLATHACLENKGILIYTDNVEFCHLHRQNEGSSTRRLCTPNMARGCDNGH